MITLSGTCITIDMDMGAGGAAPYIPGALDFSNPADSGYLALISGAV